MNDETADILVLRSDTHGLPAKDYADLLSQRLPNHRVHLARTSSDERDLIERADVVSGVDIDENLLEYAENLRLFAGVAAGYNHLPLEAFSEMGVTVTNASGIHAPNIAEQVLGYVLSFSRRLREGWEREKRHEWRHFQAEELKDSTVTVVGLGAIGTAIVDRFAGFDVHTIGVRYTPEKGGPTDEVIGFEREAFHDAVSRTDYLLIAAPLSDTTRGLVSEEEFKTLPPNARVVNVGRGQIIDTDALVSAIQNNQINGAALDVTDPEPLPADHPLWRFENVTITPHNAGHSPKHWDRLAEIVANNVNRLAETNGREELENVVRS
ncbi:MULTISPECIES: D-2-hydroxyacid dehydrogenase [unclassified Haladaptatus]|uniref:D-2-hydroxyacid dehydrogenase n=1 Tax=unclassified Haladaptatus TaxID=2622732 RepID=UPI00209C00E2|nr:MULTISPECIES: D-2-hydroxyacid dehydrogenase [unclassified Haladaptatus]MCO8243462.1 D-2-hydroxyacid dehydrogenase [Haladaptatus sp. AB643]MCO8254871.1 D-2-hydroxyacid dehydrogenase [Haladaptatus sp. AB618]